MGIAQNKQHTFACTRTVELIDRFVTAVVRPQAADGGRIVNATTASALARTGMLGLYS